MKKIGEMLPGKPMSQRVGFLLKKGRVHTAEQALAEEIWDHFRRALPFPRIMRLIKTWGRQRIYEEFNTVRKGDSEQPLKLFIWRTKNEQMGAKKLSPSPILGGVDKRP